MGRDVGTIQSLRDLGRAVGRSHTAVARWVKHPAWTFARTGPWRAADVAGMKAWAAATLAEDPAATPGKSGGAGGLAGGIVGGESQKSKAQTLVAFRRARQIELDNLLKEGKLHEVAGCRARRLRQLQDLKVRLLDIPDRLATLAPADRELVRKEITAALEQLAASYGA